MKNLTKKSVAALILASTAAATVGGLAPANANTATNSAVVGAAASSFNSSAFYGGVEQREMASRAINALYSSNKALYGEPLGMVERQTGGIQDIWNAGLNWENFDYVQHFSKGYSIYWSHKYGAKTLYTNGAFQKYFGNQNGWTGDGPQTSRTSDTELGNMYSTSKLTLKADVRVASDKVALPGGQMQKFSIGGKAPVNVYYDNLSRKTAKATEAEYKAFGFPQNDRSGLGAIQSQDFINRATGAKITSYTMGAKRGNLHTGGAIQALYNKEVASTHIATNIMPGNETAYGKGYRSIFEKTYPDSVEMRGIVDRDVVIWSPSTGAKKMNANGAIYAKYLADGGYKKYGYPVTNETAQANGTVIVKFSNGQTINWTPQKIWVS